MFFACLTLKDTFKVAEGISKFTEITKNMGYSIERINEMSNVCKELGKENALLALSTANVSKEDQKAILIKAGLFTAEEAEAMSTTTDTVATTANTAAKGANLSITELLTVAWAKFTAVVKANPFIFLAAGAIALTAAMSKVADKVYNAEKYAKKALDKSAEKVDNVKSEIESLNSELQTTRNRIDELNAKENLTLVEREELERLKKTNTELERELRIKQSILSEEQKEANKDAKKYFTTKKDSIAFESSYEGVEIHEKTDYIGTVEERIEKLQQYADGQIQLSEETIKAYKDYVESALSDFMEEDDYLVEGQDDGILARLDALYEKYDIYTNGKASVTENKMGAILAKTDFQSASKQLEELGKSGELSIDTLSSQFPELIDYLDKAGISAQELYQYIMALSNPDAINYAEVKKQLLYSIGGRQDEASEFLHEILSLSDEQLVLEAYLKVRDQYGKHPEGWTGKDWIANIQNELNNEESVEIPILFNDKLTTSQESLDKFQSSIKSASDAYATLLSGNYSTSELLDSIQAINQAVTDMKGSIDWEEIDSLDLLWNKLEEVSREYAESILSGTEIDVNSDFGRMLADIMQETYEAEAKFTGMNAQLDALQSSYQTLTGILESYNDTGYISLDNLQSLLTADENLISMLEAENGQLVLNQEAYENLVAVQLLEFKEKLNNAAAAEIEALAKQKSAEATNSSAQASEDAVAKLDAETEAFNRNTSAAIANAVTKAEEEGVSEDEIQSVLDKYNEIWNAAVNNFDGDFDSFMGGTKAAGAAGSSAGTAYVDAFEEELKELDDLHSNSLISEKEYLDRLRVLYERYFKDKLGYEKEYADYQKKYLDGYKSLYESVFSHASKVISDRINAVNDEKDSAIDSLEAQKKAAEDSYNAQIKLLEDKKDALQAEIDKIKEANEDRKQAIDLQKAEYELARMQNQRTILQYSEDKGVHYVTDTSGIRDARNDLDDKKADAQIRALEKQQDSLDKQIDAIQEMLDASNEYWDTQIEQTEKYYDAMIQGMEEYRSRWEELSDLQEQAEMAALLKELGYTEEDLADAGSGAFDRLRTSYLGILKDMNDGNQSVLDGLSRLANIDMSSIPSFLSTTQGYIDSIANIDVTALSDGLGNICDGFSNVADSVANAASAISGGNVSPVTSTGNNLSGKGSVNNKKNNANNGSSLKDAITEASTGSVEEINKISDAFAGENEEGTSVTGAVQKVMDKIGSADSDNENTDSLMSTLKEQTSAALDEESGIPAQTYAWDELNTPLGESVDLVTTLQSTLEDMDGRTFTVTLNVAGNGSPNSIVSEFSGGVSNSPSHGGGGKSRARVQGTANVEGTANAGGNWGVKKAGRSLVGELGQEIWVHSQDGTFETVGDNGAEFIDIKPNDIIFNHLQTKQLLDKGNIIGRGRSYANGSASVNGTNNEGWITLPNGLLARPLQEGDKGWDLTQKFQPLADRILKGETDIMSNAMIEHQRQMEQMAGDVTTMNVTTSSKPNVTIGDIHITCPGVTSKEVAKQVGVELNNMFSGLHLDAMQQSMMR